MSYKTYITEAIICGNSNSNTADKSFLLFTRDAGMMYASAKSVREERSKHRYALQDFSRVRVTLVHGKSGWKITGSEAIENLYTNAHSRDARAFFRNTLMLLRRVARGETAHADIFDDVITASMLLEDTESSHVETILAFRILYTLGYVAPESTFEHIVREPLTSTLVGSVTEGDRIECKKVIEHALSQSHL